MSCGIHNNHMSTWMFFLIWVSIVKLRGPRVKDRLRKGILCVRRVQKWGDRVKDRDFGVTMSWQLQYSLILIKYFLCSQCVQNSTWMRQCEVTIIVTVQYYAHFLGEYIDDGRIERLAQYHTASKWWWVTFGPRLCASKFETKIRDSQ